MINMSREITPASIKDMSYIDFMAFLNETNKPPGGKKSLIDVAQLCFLNKDKKVLHVGCSTGYSTFELNRLTGCKIVGIDISSNMIKRANEKREKDMNRTNVTFRVADATKFPFEDNTFDVVFSAGATAFFEDIQKGVAECKRVVKPWGFMVDVNFYYKKDPPQSLIDELNKTMDIHIKKRSKEDWIRIYEDADLDVYYIKDGKTKTVTKEQIEEYAEKTARRVTSGSEIIKTIKEKLIPIMELFNRNNEYLAYSIFIFRKHPDEEPKDIYLFEP